MAVGGELTFNRAVFVDIAARALGEVRDVERASTERATGFLGRLFAWGPAESRVTVDDRADTVAFSVEVVARHGVNFHDLGIEIQRRITERVRRMTARPCVVNVNVRSVSG